MSSSSERTEGAGGGGSGGGSHHARREAAVTGGCIGGNGTPPPGPPPPPPPGLPLAPLRLEQASSRAPGRLGGVTGKGKDGEAGEGEGDEGRSQQEHVRSLQGRHSRGGDGPLSEIISGRPKSGRSTRDGEGKRAARANADAATSPRALAALPRLPCHRHQDARRARVRRRPERRRLPSRGLGLAIQAAGAFSPADGRGIRRGTAVLFSYLVAEDEGIRGGLRAARWARLLGPTGERFTSLRETRRPRLPLPASQPAARCKQRRPVNKKKSMETGSSARAFFLSMNFLRFLPISPLELHLRQ